ncbi:MAG: hypothetical protein SOZ24_08825 [Treponema sp.]|nr:hypothetical protein [Treponema sp.]
MPSDKMIFVAEIPITLLSFLGIQKQQIKIYRSKGLYYVATLFDASMAKIEAYCKLGRLMKLDKTALSLQ